MKISSFISGCITVLSATLLSFLVACESEQVDPEPDCSVSDLSLTLSEKTDANCGVADGSALLTASGGEGTLMYSLSGTEQESGLFEELSAGNHTFTVTDENGCTETLEVSIGNVEGVVISEIDIQESGCKESNGTIVITASDGTEPYQYKLGEGQFQAESTFSGLSAGFHTVVVVDDFGCEFTQDVAVLTGISFDTHISPIISNNCAVSGCHDGSQAIPDFRSFSVVQSNASQIKTLTANGTMPQNGTISQAQIDMIACWVDDGALDN